MYTQLLESMYFAWYTVCMATKQQCMIQDVALVHTSAEWDNTWVHWVRNVIFEMRLGHWLGWVLCFLQCFDIFVGWQGAHPFHKNVQLYPKLRWRNGITGRALDLQSTGCGFKSYSGQKLRNNLGQVVHTYVPLSPSSITWNRPRGGDALQLGR